MAGHQTSFEDRLARISKNRQHSDTGASSVVPPSDHGTKHPRRGKGGDASGGRGFRIAMVLAVGFLALSATAFTALMTSDKVFLALAEWSNEAEH